MALCTELTYREEELPAVAAELLKSWGHLPVWAFEAPMGAGKTTLIKELCLQLGVDEATSSPTFAIVNVYQGKRSEVYHFDCYRLSTLADALSIGAEEYLESGCPCFVEWPEVLEKLLPADTLRISIEVIDPHTRRLRVG